MSFELIVPFLRPIEPLLLDESISEIMGNPDASWWYERDGILCRAVSVRFEAARLRTGLEVIANQLGKKLDEDNPVLHAQLPDGSRLAAVIPPVVKSNPAVTIRKFWKSRLSAGRRCSSAVEPGPARRRYCGSLPIRFQKNSAS
jgi:pilus assembly protein CpaF